MKEKLLILTPKKIFYNKRKTILKVIITGTLIIVMLIIMALFFSIMAWINKCSWLVSLMDIYIKSE